MMLVFNQLNTYLYLALVLFAIGLYGVLARRSLIAILISVELILNAASINFMAFNRFLAPTPAVGQVITLFIMAVAAAEAAIALSIIVAVYRKLKSINIEHATELRG
jgi:NADH:ubiquinone oxidoreductase subunit K